MFFKRIALLCSGDIALRRRTFIAIISNLKLTNVNGGKNKAMQIIEATGREMIKSFTHIIFSVVDGMTNIAKRINNLRLVTDVR